MRQLPGKPKLNRHRVSIANGAVIDSLSELFIFPNPVVNALGEADGVATVTGAAIWVGVATGTPAGSSTVTGVAIRRAYVEQPELTTGQTIHGRYSAAPLRKFSFVRAIESGASGRYVNQPRLHDHMKIHDRAPTATETVPTQDVRQLGNTITGKYTKTSDRTGYDAPAFLRFYTTALDYIIELNRQGTNLMEVYAKLILTKILTPYTTGYVDLQSPAGAGISVLVYNYDGDIYASDESRMLAEMHDHTFRLGNVHRDTYATMVQSPAYQYLLSACCNEVLPGVSGRNIGGGGADVQAQHLESLRPGPEGVSTLL